ncbi:pisatin demethylase [Eremomyces bilateralis CBS 781.70]|uniref:Pisatin demethylase n=1 Tax=Eremomyces bilateralis CBS 781.70 TaxID=1392243 RepID=A0A6G1GE32_9PEZI|nr:pisatin demethylase [Eremomyces bilateralis CBS 781.70]KAF1816357.1 pisatin demethylase [Eremomyces bilateralis CBS 781.70]
MEYMYKLETVLPSVRDLVTALFICVTFFGVLHVVYTRYFSPCAPFPGPFLASTTTLWKVASLVSGEGEKRLMALHKKYGPIVRIAPNELSVSEASAIKIIYKTFPKLFKAPFARRPGHMENTDIKQAAQRRRIVGDTYSMSKVLSLESSVDLCLQQFQERFSQFAGTGTVVNLKLWSHLFTFDVIGQLIFSQSFGFLERGGDQGHIMQAIETAIHIAMTMVNFPWYLHPLVTVYVLMIPRIAARLVAIPKPIGALETRVDRAIRGLCHDAQAKPIGPERRDFLTRWFGIYAEKGAELDFGLAEIKQEVWTALFAGSDTTSIALAATVYHLLKHPACYSRVIDEIDSADGQGLLSRPCIRYEEGYALQYLRACIKEATRLHPSGSITFPRRVPKQGCMVAGQFIPEGTEIGCNPYVVHRDRKVFGDDADRYNPDRWLGPKAAEMERHSLLFGYGPRICIGRNIALCQLYKFIPQLLRDFRLELDDPQGGWSYTLYKTDKLEVRVSKRY